MKRQKKAKPKREQPFNAAFAGLKDLAKQLKKAGAERRAAAPPPLPAPRPEMNDADLFRAEVADVDPLHGAPLPASRGVPPPALVTEDDEVRAHLDALVAGEVPFDFADSDEYIEGWVHDLDHRVLKKLKRGDFAVEAHLDLHGRSREEAKPLVREFVRKSRFEGRRCVRIVHGRGLHSKDQSPVLKEAIKTWLSRGWIGSQVLAFTSAPPADGGAGAVYVLLRK